MSTVIRCECSHPAGLHVWSGCQVFVEGRYESRRCPCALTQHEIVERHAQAPAGQLISSRRDADRHPVGV